MRRFSLRLPQVGVAAGERGLRGYVRRVGGGPVELRVERPRGVPTTGLRTWAGRARVAHRVDGGDVVFTLPGRAIDWAVTW